MLAHLPRPFTTAEYEASGLSRRTIRNAVRSGDLRRPFRGVYVPAELPDSVETRAAALNLVTSRHQVVCDRTAAWLHGIDAYALSELTGVPKVETCALRGHNRTDTRGADGHTRDLIAEDIMTIAGLKVTTPLRTALDLGCHLRRYEAMAALDMFARLHGITVDLLFRGLPRFRGRRGVVQARELSALVNALAESARESWVRLAIHDAGLPAPQLQVWVHVDGVPAYRLDHAYPGARVAVEYDGWEHHERTPEQRRADENRRRYLREQGWVIIVVRKGDFTGDNLERWLRQLRRALAEAYSTRRW